MIGLSNEAHWEHSKKKVVKGANVISLEVVVDNWHRKNLLECVDVGVVYGRQVVVDVDPVENLAQDRGSQ
jgi:hypothetical protein